MNLATAIDTIGTDLAKEIERVGEIWNTCRQFYAGDGNLLFGYMKSMLSPDSLQEWIDAALAEEEVIDIYVPEIQREK